MCMTFSEVLDLAETTVNESIINYQSELIRRKNHFIKKLHPMRKPITFDLMLKFSIVNHLKNPLNVPKIYN